MRNMSQGNLQDSIREKSSTTNSNRSISDGQSSNQSLLIFNIFGKIYRVKRSLFQNDHDLFPGTTFTEYNQLEQFYDINRKQYIIDINPLIFEKILQFYTIRQLNEPLDIQIDYFKDILNQFHIDTSMLNDNERYERIVSRQSVFQLIHVLLEYPDSCMISQVLHFTCSMVALISCLIVSLSLTSRQPDTDLYSWNTTDIHFPVRSKPMIAHFRRPSTSILIIEIVCLIWSIGETILRTLSTPSLFDYLTKLGLFDVIGVTFHFIYIFMISIGIKPSRCQTNPIRVHDTFSCITFNRRLIIFSLLRKIRLVRYIRPLKHLTLALIESKRELTRLIVLIIFVMAFLAPLIFIIESYHLFECSSLLSVPITRCIRTMTDTCYYIMLIISTVGILDFDFSPLSYGDVYPLSRLARFIAMLASPLSIMTLSVPLSSIYTKYAHTREIYQAQLEMPENVRYVVYDNTSERGTVSHDRKRKQQPQIVDVTEQLNRILKRFNIRYRKNANLDT